MSLLNALRCHGTHAHRTALSLYPPTRHAVSILLRSRTPSFNARLPPLRRHESTGAVKARKSAFLYPERLNIFRAGSPRTLIVGFTRICSLVVCVLGAGIYAPSFLFSPDHSIWWVPAVVLLSTAPIVLVTITSGPVVHAIRVHLPDCARRSKAELIRFANSTPHDTVVEFHCIRFRPFPKATELIFGDLRRIKPSFTAGLSNLENVPEVAKAHDGTWTGWLVHRWLGRFYVERDQPKDKSGAPGLWDKMWKQIPKAGDNISGSIGGSTKGKGHSTTRPAIKIPRSTRPVLRPAVHSGRSKSRP